MDDEQLHHSEFNNGAGFIEWKSGKRPLQVPSILQEGY